MPSSRRKNPRGPDWPNVIRLRGWKEFHEEYLFPYAAVDRSRRSQLIFRGHASAAWRLTTTLDRSRPKGFRDDYARQDYYEFLLAEFQREAIRFLSPPLELPEADALDLLARHHGVPSPVLDWTESPYVATFFAYEQADPAIDEQVAVWVLDRSRFDEAESRVRLIHNHELLRLNPRALQQRGVFTRIDSVIRPVEESLSACLTKIELPTTDRGLVLAHLDAMMINAANLFPDLDGAARTSRYRGEP